MIVCGSTQIHILLVTDSTQYDDSAFTMAARSGHAEIVQLLLDYGADVHQHGYVSTPAALSMEVCMQR